MGRPPEVVAKGRYPTDARARTVAREGLDCSYPPSLTRTERAEPLTRILCPRSLGRPTGGIIATALAPRSRSARSDTSNAFVAEQRADRHVGPSGDGPRGPGERLGSEPVGGAGSDVGAERGRQDRAAVRGRSGGTTRAPPRSDVASGSQRPLARRSRPRAVADRP